MIRVAADQADEVQKGPEYFSRIAGFVRYASEYVELVTKGQRYGLQVTARFPWNRRCRATGA